MKTQDIALVIKAPLAIKGIKKPSFDVEAQNDRHQFSKKHTVPPPNFKRKSISAVWQCGALTSPEK